MQFITLILQMTTVLLLIGSFTIMYRLKVNYDRKFQLLQRTMDSLRGLLTILQEKGLADDMKIRTIMVEINTNVAELEKHKYSSIYDRIRHKPPRIFERAIKRRIKGEKKDLTQAELSRFPVFCPSCHTMMTSHEVYIDESDGRSRVIQIKCLKCQKYTEIVATAKSNGDKGGV